MEDQENLLQSAVSRACQPTFVPSIMEGREAVLLLPRKWVLTNIERVANETLDLSDYWEYRRLLELYSLLDPALVERLVIEGLKSDDPDVLEAAEDFSQ